MKNVDSLNLLNIFYKKTEDLETKVMN